MKLSYNIEQLKNCLKSNSQFPCFLNKEINYLYETGLSEVYTEISSKLKIRKEEWGHIENKKFLLSLFCHFTKVNSMANLYYVEVDRSIPIDYSFETADDEKALVIFFRRKITGQEEIEECIAEANEAEIKLYITWLKKALIEDGSLRKAHDKYESVTNMLSELHEGEEDLSEEFYEGLEELRTSITNIIGDDIKISEEAQNQDLLAYESLGEILGDTQAEETKEEMEVNWKGNKIKFTVPVNVSELIATNVINLTNIDNKESWLVCQNSEIQETVCALWIDYLVNLNQESQEEGSWEGFSESLKSWLRIDCSTDIKKIERKIRTTQDRIIYSGIIENFYYVKNNPDFIKVCLFIEEMSATEQKKSCIMKVGNIQQQYFYALDNDLTMSLVWGAIVHNKLIKTRARKTIASQFEVLKDKFPNFKEVVDYYSGAMYIYEQTGTVPAPVLLLGSPGLGKTHFANEVAKVIGSQMTVIPISSLSAGWIITGAAAQWKDAQMGKVATSLLNGPTCSPVIVLDEIDKKSEGNYNPLGGLYPLLEYQTAKDFVDEYLEFPMNASDVLWVATANNLTTIDEPILDRFVVFEIKKLSEEDTLKVANTIYGELTNGIVSDGLEAEVLNLLKDKTPRQIKQMLKKGLAYAAANREPNIILKANHIDVKTKIRKIGF